MEGLIDRQKAINKIVFGIDDKAYFGDADIDWKVIDFLNSLSSVTPKEKTGKWIEKWDSDHLVIFAYECSKCGTMMNVNTSHYCPNCGARMVSE